MELFFQLIGLSFNLYAAWLTGKNLLKHLTGQPPSFVELMLAIALGTIFDFRVN